MTETQDKYLPTQNTSPASMMQVALSSGADLDKLEKMLLLQERWEANEARKAYHSAMAAFKANPPEIEKDRHVKFQTSKGITEYDHASLANVTKKISSALSLHGLSAAWKTAQSEKQITVTCTITHKLGHSESTSLSSLPDDSGGKNQIQAIGSAVSYLSRYTLLCLTGLATRDMDDDGAATGTITPEQAKELSDIIASKKIDLAKFLEYVKAESIEAISATDFNRALAAAKKAKGGA